MSDPPDLDAFFAAVYDRFNARDVEWLLERMTDDVEWPNVRAGTRLVGRDAVRAYWLDQWTTIDSNVRPLRATERPDGRVDVEVQQVLRATGSGEVVADQVVHHVYALRDGKVAAMHVEPA